MWEQPLHVIEAESTSGEGRIIILSSIMHREDHMRVRIALEEILWRMETLLWFDKETNPEITKQELRISLEDARRVLSTLVDPAPTASVVPRPVISLIDSETGGQTVVFTPHPGTTHEAGAYVTVQQASSVGDFPLPTVHAPSYDSSAYEDVQLLSNHSVPDRKSVV